MRCPPMGDWIRPAAWKPFHYKNILSVLAYGSLVEAGILIFYGVKFGLPLFPFGPDVAIALVPGIAILVLKGELDVTATAASS